MMEDKWEALLSFAYPWAHLASCTERTFDILLGVLNHRSTDIVTRIIRGKQCQTSAGFFRESAAALQFPYYFGHNWDAFEECINDLGWLPAKHYVIGVSDASTLLTQDEQRLRTVVEILSEAADAWPIYEPNRGWTKTWVTAEDGTREWAQRPVASFHAVFHCEPRNEVAIRDRFQEAGLSLAPLLISPEFSAL